jgi:hypothetical protein
MTLAVAGPASTEASVPHAVPVAIIGTDALLAAAPATPVQLAHACLRAGFASVIPASWGDELIAAAVLRRLPRFGTNPVIQCSCPIVAHRLLTVGGDLRPALLPLVAPPVAIARYVRTLSQPARTRVTYVGNCPGALDDSIDIRMTPDALLAMLAERSIVLDEQPRVFESVIPPDRRRFRSQPGGIPSSEMLWTEPGSRTLIELSSDDVVIELAQHMLSGRNVLIDASVRLGCVCSGAIAGVLPAEARNKVIALEPPRATSAVVEEKAPIELDSHIPAVSRTPVDVVAISSNPTHVPATALPPGGELSFDHRISPARGISSVAEPRPPRTSNPAMQRPVLGVVPVSRDVGGRALPRAYVARRRPSPQSVPVVSLQPHEPRPHVASAPAPAITDDGPGDAPRSRLAPTIDAGDQTSQRAAPPPLFSVPLRHLVYVLLLVIAVSAVVAVIVERSFNASPVVAPIQR